VGLEGLGGLEVAGAGIAWATQRPRNDELQAQRPSGPQNESSTNAFSLHSAPGQVRPA
jgi:hypothetical protein